MLASVCNTAKALHLTEETWFTMQNIYSTPQFNGDQWFPIQDSRPSRSLHGQKIYQGDDKEKYDCYKNV